MSAIKPYISRPWRSAVWTGAIAVAIAGCSPSGGETSAKAGPGQAGTAAKSTEGGESAGASGLKADKGVDVGNKIVRIGALNDESGPAASIGKPYALGKRILAERINAGGSGLLPDGWKIELVERDHQYSSQKSFQLYDAIKNKVLFVGTSFGTPTTLPLRPKLKRERMIAFPASLSSEMAKHENTPPTGPSYQIEAMRAMDWAVEHAGGPAAVKAAIVYQKDDFGRDGQDGWRAAAKHHGVQVVSEQSIAPTQKDFTAVVSALKGAGANYVLLTTLASATGPALGAAEQLDYKPVWIGQTPAWSDKFFDAAVIPPAVFDKFYWVTGLAFWNEDLPGMSDFMAAYEKYGKAHHPPDYYILASYIQGLTEIELLRRAIEAGDVTRDGYLKVLSSLDNWTAGGLMQPLTLSKFPYEAGTQTRLLKPDMAGKTWAATAPFAAPKALAK